MIEIRYIEGLYAYWDYLPDCFPNLLIDNCASGGQGQTGQVITSFVGRL